MEQIEKDSAPAENDRAEAAQTAKKDSDDEISLIDLFAVLLKHKRMIITVTALAMAAAIVYSIITIKLPVDKSPMPNQYTPKANMLINDSSSSGGLSSMLSSSGLSSLASLAGISASAGSSYSSLAVYLASSDPLLDAITEKFNIVNRYKIKKFPKTTSRKMLKKSLKADIDKDTSVFTVSFTDTDPVFAQSVVNFSVDWMEQRFLELGLDKNKTQKKNLEESMASSYNEIVKLQKRIAGIEQSVSNSYGTPRSVMLDTSMAKLELDAQEEVYKQLKAQYELTKIKMQSETPVFQILEHAEVPDMKSGPSRGKLCIIVTFAAFFLSVFAAFAMNAVDNIKKDPEAMNKLRGKRS